MAPRRPRPCPAVLALLLCALLLAGAARADGDPASDTLYTQKVFFPYSAKVDAVLAQELERATAAAADQGNPVRVALIAAPADLGAIPSLFGRPQAYARFLGTELQFVYSGRLLVVMPQGAALSKRGRLIDSSLVQRAVVGPGGDGLSKTALTLLPSPGRPVPAHPYGQPPSSRASESRRGRQP